MNGTFARVLNLVPRGQHAADALTEQPPYPRYPVTADAVTEARTEAFHLAAQHGTPTVVMPALSVDLTWPPRVPIAEDYRALPVFKSVVRGACRVGLTGIGTRGVHPVPFVPDYGLDRFTPDIPEADFGPEFDQVAEHAEAGFYNARRVFHSADTAGFPAVAS